MHESNLYIDGELEQELCRQLEAHLKVCDRCRIVLDTTQRTIQLNRSQTPMELPEGVTRRLHAVLRARWNKIQSLHSSRQGLVPGEMASGLRSRRT
jgi:anti-sigma factor RsiW